MADNSLARKIFYAIFAATIVAVCAFIWFRRTLLSDTAVDTTRTSAEAVSGASVQAETEEAKNETMSVNAVSGASAAHEKSPPEEDPFYDVLGNVEGINGFVIKYTDKLFRGGTLKDSAGLQFLLSHGITTVVSITPDDKERRLCEAYGLKLVELPFEKKKPVPQDALSEFIAQTRMSEGGVYVHCHGGAHRGGILAATYRIHRNNWPAEKAILEFSKLGGNLTDDNQMVQSILSPLSDSNVAARDR